MRDIHDCDVHDILLFIGYKIEIITLILTCLIEFKKEIITLKNCILVINTEYDLTIV